MYAALGCGGELDGVRLMSQETVDEARRERVAGKDVIIGFPVRRGLGFMLPVAEQGDPRGPGAFGHAGMGGSIAHADPDHRLGFAYVMNQMGPPIDSRAASLSRALYAALDAR
jgi:CubicO group peptidase (beta-lactamase class C family)